MFIPLAGGLGNLRDVENLQVSNFGSHGELLQTIQNVLVLLCMVQNLMCRLRRHFKAFKSFATNTNRGPFERPFLCACMVWLLSKPIQTVPPQQLCARSGFC